MIELREPYEKRPIRFLEEWRHEGWRLKVYGIAYRREGPRAELVEASKRLAREKLPRPAGGVGRYGVGFLAEIDRMNREVREYLSLHPSELADEPALAKA